MTILVGALGIEIITSATAVLLGSLDRFACHNHRRGDSVSSRVEFVLWIWWNDHSGVMGGTHHVIHVVAWHCDNIIRVLDTMKVKMCYMQMVERFFWCAEASSSIYKVPVHSITCHPPPSCTTISARQLDAGGGKGSSFVGSKLGI
jgi:hypothetical protein